MKQIHTLRTVAIFSLFSLLGPVMQHVSLPVFLTLHREDVAVMFWPAIALSSGGGANNSHDLWMCVAVNMVLFAILGLVVGVLGKRTGFVVTVYAFACALLTLEEAWGSGFSLAYFSWSVLVLACLLYWLPFWAAIWSSSLHADQPSSS